METSDYEDIKRDLLFRIEKSIRYHNHRKRFFIHLHNWTTFLAAISGAATCATVLAESGQGIQFTFALLAAIFSMVDLVIASPAKAREYEALARRFIAIEKQIRLLKKNPVDQLNQIGITLLDIEADEPPILRILNIICYNESIKAMGLDPDAAIKIGRFQRMFRHLWDLNPEKI